jgi:transposase InsO family protein
MRIFASEQCLQAFSFTATVARNTRVTPFAASSCATLKKELVRDCVFETRDDAGAEVFEYIEVFYNRQRAHSVLGYETPNAFGDCSSI